MGERGSTVGRCPVPAPREDIAPQSERACRVNLVWSNARTGSSNSTGRRE